MPLRDARRNVVCWPEDRNRRPDATQTLRDETTRLLKSWTSDRLQSVAVPDSGTMNDVRLVQTKARKYVLRIYRHTDRERIGREHEVVQWACDHGIPAVLPLPTQSGGTYVVDKGRLVVLLPFARGVQIQRKRLQPEHIQIMGRFLGRLHRVLESCPVRDIPPGRIVLDRSMALETIARLERTIQAIDSPTETEEHAQRRLETRRQWLQERPPESVEELFAMSFQPVHGDYQETNLFFDDGTISAIIDWDKVYTAPAAWEVIRALHLMLRFAPGPCHTFLSGYRELRPLTMDELDVAARCYGLMRAYDLWLYQEIYEAGNDRVRQFVRPGDFAPIEWEWSRLRAELGES